MVDFRVKVGWRSHPKRKCIRRKFGADGVLYIEDLWSFAAEYHTDGVLTGMDAEKMAAVSDYPGDAQCILDGCVELRLIDKPTEKVPHYSLHDWSEHQPWLANSAERSVHARKAATEKWKKKYGVAAQRMLGAESGMLGASSEQCSTDAPSPIPIPIPIPDNNIKIKNNKNHAKRRKSSLVEFLMTEGVQEQTASDFCELRYAKRAPLTKTAIENIKKEAIAAGMSLHDALTVCCSRGWQGFRAEWVRQNKNLEDRNKDALRRYLAKTEEDRK